MEELRIGLRPARTDDLEYCLRLYLAGTEVVNRELELDREGQAVGLRRQWDCTQVQIITLDSEDVGWIQTRNVDNALFLVQIFVDSPFQRRGIGTEVLTRLIAKATMDSRAVILGVVKINAAVRLYQRLGFQIEREDDHRFYMRLDPRTEGPTRN